MGISVEEYRKMLSNDSKKNDKYMVRGKVNHDLGKNFEERIEEMCIWYEEKGLAKIEKTPEPMRILKHLDAGRFEATFVKSAEPDFKGTLKGGRTIVFDAKYTEHDRINYIVLKDHQRESLLKYKELGAMAFVLVGFTTGKMYKIDIDDWANMKEKFGRKFIKEQELIDLNYKTDDFIN